MKKIVLTGLILLVGAAGCTTMYESGPYPDQRGTNAAVGAAIGAAPGMIMRSGPVALGGALLGGGIGTILGGAADAETMAREREYRRQKEEEWKETYKMLVGSAGTSARGAVSSVIVVSSGYSYSRGWEYDVVLTVEQGLRQRQFAVVVPRGDYYYQSYYRRHNYSAYDADFLAEVHVMDLSSAIKVTVTLRSLRGMSVLDRQGTGEAYYSREYYRYGPSYEERRARAGQLAAKRAVENLLIYGFSQTLEAGT